MASRILPSRATTHFLSSGGLLVVHRAVLVNSVAFIERLIVDLLFG